MLTELFGQVISVIETHSIKERFDVCCVNVIMNEFYVCTRLLM